jgi:hypothetical protein
MLSERGLHVKVTGAPRLSAHFNPLTRFCSFCGRPHPSSCPIMTSCYTPSQLNRGLLRHSNSFPPQSDFRSANQPHSLCWSQHCHSFHHHCSHFSFFLSKTVSILCEDVDVESIKGGKVDCHATNGALVSRFICHSVLLQEPMLSFFVGVRYVLHEIPLLLLRTCISEPDLNELHNQPMRRKCT